MEARTQDHGSDDVVQPTATPVHGEPPADLVVLETQQELAPVPSRPTEFLESNRAQIGSSMVQLFTQLLGSLERLSQTPHAAIAIVALCAMFFGFLIFLILLLTL